MIQQDKKNMNANDMGGPTFHPTTEPQGKADAAGNSALAGKQTQPAHARSQSADPGEFKSSMAESKRSPEDGRDD